MQQVDVGAAGVVLGTVWWTWMLDFGYVATSLPAVFSAARLVRKSVVESSLNRVTNQLVGSGFVVGVVVPVAWPTPPRMTGVDRSAQVEYRYIDWIKPASNGRGSAKTNTIGKTFVHSRGDK